MKQTDKTPVLFAMSAVMIVVAVFVTFLASFLSFGETGGERDYEDFSKGWLTESGEEVLLDNLRHAGRIHKEIPPLEHDVFLSFNARNVDVDVYVDDVCVYQHMPTKDPMLRAIYGKSAGSDFVDVPLTSETAGKTLTIDICNPYRNSSYCKIVHMFLGDGMQIVRHDASLQLGPFLLSSFWAWCACCSTCRSPKVIWRIKACCTWAFRRSRSASA